MIPELTGVDVGDSTVVNVGCAISDDVVNDDVDCAVDSTDTADCVTDNIDCVDDCAIEVVANSVIDCDFDCIDCIPCVDNVTAADTGGDVCCVDGTVTIDDVGEQPTRFRKPSNKLGQ